MTMGWFEFILGIASLVLGTGWLFTYRAYKRKSEGEASQAEAGGWEAQQKVYQNTIEDLEKSCNFIRADRDLLRKENEQLRKENMELRKRIGGLEDKILEMQKEIARNGRRIEALVNKGKKKNKKDEEV
jgi:peptidoglycan hydrolase CwlO-like protein